MKPSTGTPPKLCELQIRDLNPSASVSRVLGRPSMTARLTVRDRSLYLDTEILLQHPPRTRRSGEHAGPPHDRIGKNRMIVLGIKANGHDTGAAILHAHASGIDVTAISEARLNRSKHSYRFPLLSIDYCLESVGLRDLAAVDLIMVDRHAGQSLTDIPRFMDLRAPMNDGDFLPTLQHALLRSMVSLANDRTQFVSHLSAHAASAYFPSPFDAASTLVVDGGFGIFETRRNAIRAIDQNGYSDNISNGRPAAPRNLKSTGCLYEHITQLLGYSGFDSGKTMALAAYGNDDGPVPVNQFLSLPPDRFSDTLMNYRSTMDAASARFGDDDELRQARDGEAALATRRVQLARAAQQTLEEDVLFLAKEAKRKAGQSSLAYAGGVALSCVTNRKLIDSGEFEAVWVQPAASDEGIPLGCALFGYHSRGNLPRWRMTNAYLGRQYETSGLESLLRKCGLSFHHAGPNDIAEELAKGRVVARVAGPSEYGPRALGNRSILADPRRADMVEHLNRRVKHREGFRPFAPACHRDKMARYFDIEMDIPYMVVAAQVRAEMRSRIPAVTHIDGSSRPQTVTREQNPRFYDLIDAFGALTEIYCLVNTSFNNNGEPIVETFEDALISFASMGIDYLLLEDVLIERPRDLDWVAPLRRRRAEKLERHYEDCFERLCDINMFDRVLDVTPKLIDGSTAREHFDMLRFGPFPKP